MSARLGGIIRLLGLFLRRASALTVLSQGLNLAEVVWAALGGLFPALAPQSDRVGVLCHIEARL